MTVRSVDIGAALLSMTLAGCTSGNRWVNAPEDGSPCTAEPCSDAEARVGIDSSFRSAATGGQPQGFHRTISLGEVWDESQPGATAESGEPSDVTGSHDELSAPVYPYYGGWYGGWLGRAVRVTRDH
jgi:hypothetical protein